jgi:hypothetical protein
VCKDPGKAGLAGYTSIHTSQDGEVRQTFVMAFPEMGSGHSQSLLHSVWGRVVPDIPAFCRELVAALTEQ